MYPAHKARMLDPNHDGLSLPTRIALVATSLALISAWSACEGRDLSVPDHGSRPGAAGAFGPPARRDAATHVDAAEDASARDVETPSLDDDASDAALDDGDVEAAGTVCEPGADQTCNENPILSSLHGSCTDAGTCVCKVGEPNPTTGRCP